MRPFVSLPLAALSFAIGAAATPATANTISYSWSGIVDHVVSDSTAAVAVGQHIHITLSLNDAVSDTDPSASRGSYQTVAANPPILVLGVDIGGVTDVGAFQFATVLHNDGGIDEFDVDTGDTLIGDRFHIQFTTSHPGVLSSDALPLSIDPTDFETATFSVNETGPFEQFLPVFDGTIRNVSTVPLPDALPMFALALSALAGLSLRGAGRAHRRTE